MSQRLAISRPSVVLCDNILHAILAQCRFFVKQSLFLLYATGAEWIMEGNNRRPSAQS